MKIKANERKAISPIIATVLIIAATLIAFAAIGGYVFGIFGSASNTANVTVVSATMPVGAVTAVGTTVAQCAGTLLTSGTLTLSNTGSASATATSLSITFGGATYSAATTGANCVVTSGSSTFNLLVTVKATPPSSGATYNGVVTLNNGAQVTFTGTFQ